MGIIQKFYVDLAGQYDKLFLDCACGIGTQALGLAALGIYISSIPLISTSNIA